MLLMFSWEPVSAARDAAQKLWEDGYAAVCQEKVPTLNLG